MTVGQFVKVFMVDAGLNQKQLAEKMGVHTPVINDIFSGKRALTIKYAKSLEDIFGIPAIVFLTMQTMGKL